MHAEYDNTHAYTQAYCAARDAAPELDRHGEPFERLRAAYSMLLDADGRLAAVEEERDAARDKLEHETSARELAEEERDAEKRRAEELQAELDALADDSGKRCIEELRAEVARLIDACRERDAAVERFRVAAEHHARVERQLREERSAMREQWRRWIGDDATAVATAMYWREQALERDRDLVERTRERDAARAELAARPARRRARKEAAE
jgi:hypothetical protein